MSLESIAEAVRRARDVFARRPSAAEHDDSTALTTWQAGLRCVSTHPSGAQFTTDMPREVGGSGEHVTPGWFFRAGLAACTATTIAARAADEGIDLTVLEVRVDSRSDARGFLAMQGEDGSPVCAAPSEIRMHVRIAARGASAQALHEFVARAQRCSPIQQAMVTGTPLTVSVELA